MSKKIQEKMISKTFYPVEQRHRYRYNEVIFKGQCYLAKRSCRHCHGIGIVGWTVEDLKKKIPRAPIYCKCLIKSEEKKDV